MDDEELEWLYRGGGDNTIEDLKGAQRYANQARAAFAEAEDYLASATVELVRARKAVNDTIGTLQSVITSLIEIAKEEGKEF